MNLTIFHWLQHIIAGYFCVRAGDIQERLENKTAAQQASFCKLYRHKTKYEKFPQHCPKWGGGRMSSCKFQMTLRKRTRPDTTLRSKANPSNTNAGAGVSCSCGKLCKGILGLRIHQSKANCQLAENNLKSPTKKCFVSIKNLLMSSIFKFGDLLYWRTPANSFIQI